MKIAHRILTCMAFALFLVFPLATLGQWNKKPYTEWSEKDAKKVLNDSPWSQDQNFTDTSKNMLNHHQPRRNTVGDCRCHQCHISHAILYGEAGAPGDQPFHGIAI